MQCCLGKKKQQKRKAGRSSSSSDDELRRSDRSKKSMAVMKRKSIQRTRSGGKNMKDAISDAKNSLKSSLTHLGQQMGEKLHRGEGPNNIGNDSPHKKYKNTYHENSSTTPQQIDYNGLTAASKKILNENKSSDAPDLDKPASQTH